MPPLITIVTPLHNGASYIQDNIRSVQAQTMGEYEHIIVNDRSSDGGELLVAEAAKLDPRIKLLHSDAPGAARARNTAILAAQGQYIAFLDCDDYWTETKLQKQVDYMTDHDLAFCWSGYTVVDGKGDPQREQAGPAHASSEDILTKRVVVGCLTVIFDRSRIPDVLMPEIRMRQDMCFFVRLAIACEQNNLNSAGIPEPLAFYRVHGSNMSGNKLRAARFQWRAYREVFGFGLFRSASLFSSYALNGVRDRV